jgi:hypothetical protein
MPDKIIATSKRHLRDLIDHELNVQGKNCDLNHIDVSLITDMKNIFSGLIFNGNVSEWDVSNVTDMTGMFSYTSFNGDLSKWNVSKVKSMSFMFRYCDFNRNISNWNVASLETMASMFRESNFEQDISKWKPYKLKSSADAFNVCKAPEPYWLKYKDAEERNKAIEVYSLHRELNEDLKVNDNRKKNVKI